jgi:surfeit locus 1 family protein
MSQPPETPAAIRAKSGLALAQLPRALFGRRRWWATLLVILGVALLARLGIWQLDRLDQRRAQNAELARQLDAAPLELTGAALPAAPEELVDRAARVRGTFDPANQFVLALQTWQGRPGVHLLTPLRIADSDVAVLVDRGWIPDEEYRAGSLAPYDPAGEQEVIGVIGVSQLRPDEAPIETDPGRLWYRVEIEGMAQLLPYELLPVYLQELSDPDATPALPYKAPREIDLSEGPHLGYAIQWFAFAILLAAGYVYLVVTRPG